MNTHSELRDQESNGHSNGKLSDKDTDSVSPEHDGSKKLKENGQVDETQEIEVFNRPEIAEIKNHALGQEEKPSDVLADDHKLGKSNGKINRHTDYEIVKNSSHETSNGHTEKVEYIPSEDSNGHTAQKEPNGEGNGSVKDNTTFSTQQKHQNGTEVPKSDQIATDTNGVDLLGPKRSLRGNLNLTSEEEHKDAVNGHERYKIEIAEQGKNSSGSPESSNIHKAHTAPAQKENEANGLANNSPVLLNDSTKTESCGSNHQENNAAQNSTAPLKGCLCHPHDLTYPRHSACGKKVHFKEEDILVSSIASTARNFDEFTELIPTDRLDNMTSSERFSEYDQMIEKGISLRNRQKLEQAASVFEIAVDIINPIYFRDSPTMLKQAQKNLIVGLINAASCNFSIERFNETCKNTYHVLKLDALNLEAIYYYGTSKMKLGDVNEAARVFIMAKKASSTSGYHESFREKIDFQMKKLLQNNPNLDLKKTQESVDNLFPDKKKLSHKRALIFAASGFVPAVVVVYFLTAKLKMPRRRRILTSISSGILVSFIGFLFEKLY